MRVVLLLSLALVAACTGLRDSGSPAYLLPRLDANGNTYLEKTELPTLSSPYKVEGTAARVYLDPQADSSGMSGKIAEPHLAKSGNLFIPLDTDSGVVLAVYAFFERVYFYEQRVLINSKISWPRTVGIFKNVTGLPAELENNALYMGSPADAYAILPYDDSSRVALSLNDGVLAHEHFHAHFDRAVMTQLAEIRKATVADQSLALVCPRSPLQFELLVLRGWNEGLADFYGAMFSGRPKFMQASLPIFKSRDLSLPPIMLNSADQIREALRRNSGITGIKGCMSFTPYYNGEQIARILYHIAANGDFRDPRPAGAPLNKWETAARYVHYRLQEFPSELPARVWGSIETDYVLQFLLAGVKLSAQSCEILQTARLNMRGYPQCAFF